jgi:hypothetical protein
MGAVTAATVESPATAPTSQAPAAASDPVAALKAMVPGWIKQPIRDLLYEKKKVRPPG